MAKLLTISPSSKINNNIIYKRGQGADIMLWNPFFDQKSG